MVLGNGIIDNTHFIEISVEWLIILVIWQQNYHSKMLRHISKLEFNNVLK